MPAQVEVRLCELRRRHPDWGQRRLAHELVREGGDPPPGLTGIYRALLRNGLIELRARRRRKAAWRRWERDRPMQLWQMDVMGGVWRRRPPCPGLLSLPAPGGLAASMPAPSA